MGMSASQVRFLSLQSRKNSIGTELTRLSNKKLALSRDMNKVSQTYTDALNKTTLKWSNDSGATYKQLTYDLMMKPNDNNSETPYIVSTRDGRVVVDSTGNLTGRTYDSTTGEFSDYTQLDKSYKYFAEKITNATALDGSTGSTYTTTDGLLAGTSNAGAYVVPSGAMEYGFENTLRYEIFEELGLVSTGTTAEYNNLLNQMYGSEEAYKNGNYSSLLKMYLNNGINQSNSGSSLTIAGVDYGTFAQNFGKIDETTGTWAVDSSGNVQGSLMGNLALAELAISEYDTWCKTLHELNLNTTTDLTFTATSGRTNVQTIQPVIDMNKVADASNQSLSHDTSTALDSLAVKDTTNSDGAVKSSFADIYNTDYWVKVDGNGTIPTVQVFVTELSKSFLNATNATAADGSTFSKVGNDDYVTYTATDTNGDNVTLTKSVTEAAVDYASKMTYQYYYDMAKSGVHMSTGRSYGSNQAYNAANSADKDDANGGGITSTNGDSEYNGVVSNTRKFHWYEKLGSFFAGLAQDIGGTLIAGVGAGWAYGNFNPYGVVFNGNNAYEDTFHDGNTSYALNLAMVQRTFFTYYQMYMLAHEKGVNLLMDDQSLSSTSNTYTVDDNAFIDSYSAIDNATMKTTGDWATIGTNGDTYTYRNGQTYKTYSVTETDENGQTTPSSGRTNEYYTFDGGSYQKVVNDDGSSSVTYSFTPPQTYGDSTFNKIIVSTDTNGDVSYAYYNGTTQAEQPKKVQTVTTSEYGGLKVSTTGYTFADSIYAYVSPDVSFVQQLEKDKQSAQDAIDEMQDRMATFFSGKETKLMDYYDAIFLRIAQNGWVNDTNINTTNGTTYLNNKLQNNDYFVTVCEEKADDSGYNYTNKMATSVSKVFQVNDDNDQQKALSKYESDKALISSKENKVDIMMSQLETEQEAIKTELDSVQKIISENVDKTFKIFA